MLCTDVGVSLRRRTSLCAAALALSAWRLNVAAQAPHELNVYDLVDAGPVAPPGSCSCIAAPFTLPYRAERIRPMINPRHLADDRASFTPRAEDGLGGNPHASIGVAMHLSTESALAGRDPKFEEETVRWLHLAAAQEHPDAFRLLGFRYFHGRGVEPGDAASAYWFHQGALRGDAISMVALGLRYAAGRGVPQDWARAVRWWQRAEATAPLAKRFTGDAYACGVGVDQHHGRAVDAYKAAIARGETTASIQLGHMLANRCVDGGDEAAVQAFERAADEGYPAAEIALSDLVRQGRGVDPNPYRAYTLARLAELRLPDGPMRKQAAALVNSAVRLMTPEAVPAQEALVQSLLESMAKPIR